MNDIALPSLPVTSRGAGSRAVSRRKVWVVITASALAGLTLSILPASGQAAGGGGAAPRGGAATTRPGAISPANKQAALDHFQKAKDLYEQKKYPEANAENEQALKLDPTLDNAQLLKIVLRDALAGTGATDAGTPGQPVPAGKAKTLTPQQVSVVRLMEMGNEDRTIRGVIPRKTLEDFWENVIKKETNTDTSQQAHDNFVNPGNFSEQARRIRDAGNSKYFEQITISNDPADLVTFRTSIHTFVLQSCATADCHGGDKAGNFRLATAGTITDTVLYTNFYVMSMYAAKGGAKMIDRDSPEKSLFLQYSLPRVQAAPQHPGTLDIRKLASPTDRRFRDWSTWVDGLNRPRPNYGFTFDVSGLPAPAPVPAPATKPK